LESRINQKEAAMSAIRIIIASALITAAAMRTTAAFAEPAQNSDANVSIVRTADLDLSTEQGRRALDHRLVIAARAVCDTASNADLVGKNRARDCVATVLAEARAKSDLLASRGGSIAIAAR
jgi:UrcA family protein